MDAKMPTPRHITIKMPNFKDKERILRAAGEKLVNYRGGPVKLSADSQSQLCRLEGIGEKYSKLKSSDL